MKIGNGGFNHSLRINTRSMESKTSSNQSFNDHLRTGLSQSVNLAKDAIKNISARIPGTAQLSASLSESAEKLAQNNNLTEIGDLNGPNLQDNLIKNNQEMFEQQVKISQVTTKFQTGSFMIKALFDSLKTIGSNIR